MTQTQAANWVRSVFGLVLFLIAVSCSDDGEQAAVEPDPTATEVSTAEAVPSPDLSAATDPTTAVPTKAPTPSAVPAPEPTSTAVAPLPDPPPIVDLQAAKSGTFVIARPGAGVRFDDSATIVPVYDEPGGQPRLLVDRNNIDGVRLVFPLRNPSVFDQPLVLRVISGTPSDEWILVQAPVRPHRQYVWVRVADFVFGRTDLRIEVDLGRDGLFTLFDGETEMISTQSVYGRETRPTVLNDTYVEQAFDASVLSPAYGTYILTIASYSEALGTFGGGGLPGQSLHGTNQPELVGQRVSSGGIRVPNEVIEFVFDQPGILGASVVIYDSSGSDRGTAIALQRNKPWTRAETTDFSPEDVTEAPIPSYS